MLRVISDNINHSMRRLLAANWKSSNYLSARVHVNAKSSSGNTPLGEAITTFRKVEVKIVELLIASGADVNSKRRTGGGTARYSNQF